MMLNPFWLWIAAAASLACWAIHTFVGGRKIVPPLRASDLPGMPKHVLVFVWHIVTILLFVMTAGYALAALYPQAWMLAVQATVLNAAIAVLIMGVSVRFRMPFRDMPQWTLFLAIAVFGGLAMWL